MTPVWDVVVVGGGPAGVAAAISLRRRNRAVLLVDAARFPRDKICGESVSPEAWRLLRDLGAASRVAALSPHEIRGMALTSPDGTRFHGDYTSGEAGFAMRRAALDSALLDVARAAGVEVREATRATGLLGDGDDTVQGVHCDGETGGVPVRARIVVGADGRRSLVGRSLRLLREVPGLRRFAVRGYWEGVQGLGDRGEMHVGRGGYCGIAPLSSTRANVAFVLGREAMRDAAGDLERFYRRTLAVRFPRIAERLDRAGLLEPPRAVGPLALESRRVSAPGVLLVGDAAGFYDPFTGEGIALAMRGAILAAEIADRALGARDVRDLSAYDRRRAAETRDKFRFNRLLQAVVERPRLADVVARRLARRRDLADRLVGIAGEFVPARSALNLGFALELLRG
jgi:geranylgeranyl reductase family protein